MPEAMLPMECSSLAVPCVRCGPMLQIAIFPGKCPFCLMERLEAARKTVHSYLPGIQHSLPLTPPRCLLFPSHWLIALASLCSSPSDL